MKKNIKYIIAILIAVIIDQYIKILVITKMNVSEVIFELGGFKIKYIQNYGAAFGNFSKSTEMLTVLTGLLIVIAIFYFLICLKSRKKRSKVLLWGLTLIIGGGIGNLIDRITLGYVVDYISFWDFPIFNFADMLVVIGAGLIVIYVIFIDGKKKI